MSAEPNMKHAGDISTDGNFRIYQEIFLIFPNLLGFSRFIRIFPDFLSSQRGKGCGQCMPSFLFLLFQLKI